MPPTALLILLLAGIIFLSARLYASPHSRGGGQVGGLTFEAEPGQYYNGVVKRIVDFGAFVEIMPGTDGLVHISELENRRVDRVTDVVSEGDDVVVKVINIDEQGRIRLSRKQAFGVDPDEVLNLRG